MPATEESKAQEDTEMTQEEPEANGSAEGKDEFKRPDGCWFWLDNETYQKSATNGESNAGGEEEKLIKEPGDSFKGETKEGESKADAEKALKDSRGGAGANALDQVKASEDDPGKTSKVGDVATHLWFIAPLTVAPGGRYSRGAGDQWSYRGASRGRRQEARGSSAK